MSKSDPHSSPPVPPTQTEGVSNPTEDTSKKKIDNSSTSPSIQADKSPSTSKVAKDSKPLNSSSTTQEDPSTSNPKVNTKVVNNSNISLITKNLNFFKRKKNDNTSTLSSSQANKNLSTSKVTKDSESSSNQLKMGLYAMILCFTMNFKRNISSCYNCTTTVLLMIKRNKKVF